MLLTFLQFLLTPLGALLIFASQALGLLGSLKWGIKLGAKRKTMAVKLFALLVIFVVFFGGPVTSALYAVTRLFVFDALMIMFAGVLFAIASKDWLTTKPSSSQK